MEYKNIKLIIVATVALTILSTSCSISVIRNIYNVEAKTFLETDRRCAELVEVTTYVFPIIPKL